MRSQNTLKGPKPQMVWEFLVPPFGVILGPTKTRYSMQVFQGLLGYMPLLGFLNITPQTA